MEEQHIISSGILELYATGLASADEIQQVEKLLQKNLEIAAELNAIQSGLEAYAKMNAVTPANGIKEIILSKINAQPLVSDINPKVSTSSVIPFTNYWKLAAAAAIALLIGSAVLNVNYYNKYNTATTELQQSQQQLALVQQQSNEIKNDLDIVHNRYSVAVALAGQPASPDATAKIFWMKNTGDVMIDASNLPDAPAGKQYQFWAIVDGVAVDGGLIITNDKGKKVRMQKMKSFGKAQAFAISLEKEGGNPTPTAVVSMGKI